MQLSAIRSRTRFYLGVDEEDAGFPDEKLDAFINDWLNALYADYPADVLVQSATLVADPGQEHTYTFAQQSPAITNFRKALEVRVTDDSGRQLRERAMSELETVSFPAYAITGADDVAVLVTAPGVSASAAIFLRSSFWPDPLEEDEDEPTAVPTRFQHLAALGAAELSFASGDEATFPDSYARMLNDGRESLLLHMAMRSLDVGTRRHTEARTT